MSSASRFSNFPARFYLEKYYAHVGIENESFLHAVASSVQTIKQLGTVLELGGGPSLCGMFAMTAATRAGPERVVWLDVGMPNMTEIAAWLRQTSQAFDYARILNWLSQTFAVRREEIVERLCAASWDMRCVDLSHGLPQDLRGTADVVGSYFLAEAAAGEEQGFVELTRRVGEAASPAGRVTLAYIRHSEAYRLEDPTLHPAFAVDETTLPRLLDAAGLRFAEVEIRRGPRETPPARPGYDGMVFVSGQLRPQNASAQKPVSSEPSTCRSSGAK